MVDAIETFSQETVDPINVYPFGTHPNPVGTYEFDYTAAAGNEDSLINNVKVGDLVYVNTTGKVKKVKLSTPNATLLATVVGIVTGIQIADKGEYFSEYDFTADGGALTVLTGKGIEWFGDKVTIHNDNTSSADTRDPFAYGTHVTSAALAGLVRPGGKVGSRDVYSFA